MIIYTTGWGRWSTGNCARSWNLTTTKWYMHKPESVLEKEMHKISWDFKIQAEHLIPHWKLKCQITNKNENLPFSEICHKVKIKNKRRKERQALRTCLRTKKPWNIWVTVIAIVIGVLGKGAWRVEIGGRVETIQSTTLLRLARILRRALKICCHWHSNKRSSGNASMKNS